MFKSAATKIAHNTTIPALAGNSDLRPLQDLITAEKTVLMSLQKLRMDFAKAGDALRIWGQGEGDDLTDILAASSTILAHFAAALSTYSSLHQAVRDSMKSIRTREEALDDLRRRRRRVSASAEAAEKKLHKMSPEHKNLGVQADVLNKLRDEMRALDGEIVREEAELGDYKRKCTRDWMGFKFGGLVECCEKGVIVGAIGRQIIQSIPEDVTQPGLTRAYYNAHGRVGDLVVEAQRAVSQVTFSSTPSGHVPASIPISQPPPPTSRAAPEDSHFLPTPSLGSELTLGMAMYSPPPGPPPANRQTSVDELGIHIPSAHDAAEISSLPTNKAHDPPPPPPSVDSAQPLSFSVPYDGKVVQTEENQSLMASIADVLSQSHRGFSFEEATSHSHPAADEPLPKHEPTTDNLGQFTQSEPHGPATNGHANSLPFTEGRGAQWHRRTTRRSTSPPSLPPGAAPAAIRAWDDKTGQGEDGTHSDRPASSSTRVPSQRPISSSGQDGEEEEGLAYDRKSLSWREEGGVSEAGKHHEEDTSFSEGSQASVSPIAAINNETGTTPIQRSVSTVSIIGNARPLARAESQWRIPRVPPPPVDAEEEDTQHVTARDREEDETRTNESEDIQAHHEAAAREVSRAMDQLMFSAIASPSPSGHVTPRPPSGFGPGVSMRSQGAPPSSPVASTPYDSAPSSPMLPPNPPFANQGRTSPGIEARQHPVRHQTSSQSFSAAVPTTTLAIPISTSGGQRSPASLRSMSPMHRSPPLEYPRPTPPYSTNLMASSTSSLNGGSGGASPGGAPRTISAAAFRRQQLRSPSGTDISSSGPADTSPLTLRKPSGSHSPLLTTSLQQQTGSGSGSPAPVSVDKGLPKAPMTVMNPDLETSDEEDGGRGEGYDHVGTYSGENAGYAAGKYVSDLERHG